MPDDNVIRTPRAAGNYHVFLNPGLPEHGRLFKTSAPMQIGLCSFESMPVQLQLVDYPGQEPVLISTQHLAPVPAFDGDYWVFQGFADGGLQLLSVTRFFPSSGWIHQHSAVLRIGTLIVDDRDSHPVECDERLLAHLGAFGSFTVLKKEGEKLLFCRAA